MLEEMPVDMWEKDPKVSSTYASWEGGTKSTFTASGLFFSQERCLVGSLARLSMAEAWGKKSTSEKATGEFPA